ncbi:ATP-binding protein [Algimonas porphyrae]|uniref:histidine kinase n=1 Tax=Algimonas porphyrae TaxID=1128113 RepID=A0ABQ5UZV6_9PROT|nr:ATP-binding protein [Algimonas porphyrae]GLQ20252.1 two-component sensor histidine kinase [Algimonas porphyrae]
MAGRPSLKQFVPKSIFGRSLLIIILPVVVMQMIVAYIFFNAHWATVTANLTESVAADVAVATELYSRDPSIDTAKALDDLLRPDMQLSVRLKPGEALPQSRRRNFFSVLDQSIGRALANAIDEPFWFDTTRYPHHIDIRVAVDEGVLQFYAARDRVFAPTGFVFIFWLVTATILLTLVSVLYIRRQSVPIRELADAADAFGKGQDVSNYKPHGAAEVRRAGQSFMRMRQRIRRHLDQRTLMLAGVSHDLRTPLTRLKLALSMAETKEDIAEARHDVDEMEAMLSAYLDFAHGAGRGDAIPVRLDELLLTLGEEESVPVTVSEPVTIDARPQQIRRAVLNLVNNARKYARDPSIALWTTPDHLLIRIDDAGPGIPEDKREDVLRPFARMDDARTQNVEGVGLGLAVARDIAQIHGGRLKLDDSPRGGLRATIQLPR